MVRTLEKRIPGVAVLRQQVDTALLRTDLAIDSDSVGSDLRIWYAEEISGDFDNLRAHLAGLYVQHVAPLTYGFLMANRTEALQGNVGSGGGWHRDAWKDQHKVFCYLSDVDGNNGGFEYIPGSNLKWVKKIDRYKFNKSTRHPGPKKKPRLVTGPEGTVFIADTTLLHRGRPLQHGSRYAVTLYGVSGDARKTASFKRKFEDLKENLLKERQHLDSR